MGIGRPTSRTIMGSDSGHARHAVVCFAGTLELPAGRVVAEVHVSESQAAKAQAYIDMQDQFGNCSIGMRSNSTNATCGIDRGATPFGVVFFHPGLQDDTPSA